MDQVWEPFKAEKLHEFYHVDVIGHHRQQTLSYTDLENRLAWDRENRTNQTFNITDIIAEEDRFAIRFVFTAAEKTQNQEAPIEVIYFYHLRDGKISEFWLLASVDFDYKQRA
ncbi:MAG: ester cyclase [Candidatus Udaeobacter sp.]